jgi:hypothetical protein
VGSEHQGHDALERRVASLEDAVRELSAELERTRGGRTPDTSAPDTAPATSTPSVPKVPYAGWELPNVDLESLIGRYGTLVLATVSALAAVGLFLGWAIDKGLLGPTQRIALGLIAAAGLAVGGLRLRRRERSFGASLLGLSLAVTHVCAWGAGPALQIVPAWGAFLLAALTSIALATFAHAEDDEPLWSVGFSGAAVAPFVTASGRSNLVMLAAYGVAVLASAGYAMGARRWVVAGRLLLLAALLYTAALATGRESDFGPLLAMGFPLAVAVAGVVPWSQGLDRRERLRAMGTLATLAAIRSALGMNHPLEPLTVASLIAAAGVLWMALVDRTHDVAGDPSQRRRPFEGDWLDAGVLPVGFAVAFVMAIDGSARDSGIAFAAAALLVLVTVMRFPQGGLRDAAAFATTLLALLAALFLTRGHPFVLTVTIAVLSLFCFAAHVRWSSVSWTTLGTIGLAWSALASLGHLTARVAYDYPPFATEASAVSAAVLGCILVAWRLARESRVERVVQGAAVIWAFLWVHQEIAFAFNPTAATLLRVSYYAATSVASVGIGRARRIPLLRHIGLGLAILAAGTALYGARNLEAVGARIGADLVAAVFLLAIAYWYRTPGTRAQT